MGMVLTLSKVITVEGLNGSHLLEQMAVSPSTGLLLWELRLPEHVLSKTGGAAV